MGTPGAEANNAKRKELGRGRSRGAVMMAALKAYVGISSTDVVHRNHSWNLRFESANVGSLVGRRAEMVEMMERRKVNLAWL